MNQQHLQHLVLENFESLQYSHLHINTAPSSRKHQSLHLQVPKYTRSLPRFHNSTTLYSEVLPKNAHISLKKPSLSNATLQKQVQVTHAARTMLLPNVPRLTIPCSGTAYRFARLNCPSIYRPCLPPSLSSQLPRPFHAR
jgi:hypothetical protein